MAAPLLCLLARMRSAPETVAITVRNLVGDTRIAARLALGALIGGLIVLAVVNNQRSRPEAMASYSADNETIVYRHMAATKSPIEDEGEPALDEPEESGPLSYPRPVQTIKFVHLPASPGEPVRTRVGAFVAFPGKQPIAGDEGQSPAGRPWKHADNMEEVDRYLWEVYQRAPTKRDGSGDFTWKDPAAAARAGMSLPEYAIGGMDPDFREQLYHAGQAMDAAGIRWSLLSAFRDDYRQGLAAGFKAKVGNSLHGGSRATGGYGHGRAIDITNADGEADVVWRWLDGHGAKFGLHRPIPGRDPAHVQSRGDWHKLGVALREVRLRAAEAARVAKGEATPEKGKVVAKASW
jgi:hypothetical protein